MMSRVAEVSYEQLPDGWSTGAAGYDVSFAPHLGAYAEEAIRLMALTRGERLLDVGAGSGAVALRAAQLGADVTAVDFAPGMVSLLNDKFRALGLPATVREMDGQALDLPGGHFDAACSMFGLIFFPDLDAGLRELVRVVRPGGRVVVGAWDRTGIPLLAAIQAGLSTLVPSSAGATGTPAFLRLGDGMTLKAALEAAGLQDAEVHELSHSWHIEDPLAFFRRLPGWTPGVQTLFTKVPPEALDEAASAFAEALGRSTDTSGGVPAKGLLACGIR